MSESGANTIEPKKRGILNANISDVTLQLHSGYRVIVDSSSIKKQKDGSSIASGWEQVAGLFLGYHSVGHVELLYDKEGRLESITNPVYDRRIQQKSLQQGSWWSRFRDYVGWS